MVESHVAERPTEHLHLHTMEDLLVLSGAWPTLRTLYHDWVYDSFVDLALEFYKHLAITEDACNLSPFETRHVYPCTGIGEGVTIAPNE